MAVVKFKQNNTNPRSLYQCETFNFFSQSTFSFEGVDMSWSCRTCEKSFSRKDSMQRHMNNRHSNPSYIVPFNAMPYSTGKSQRFQFEHPFTCMLAGMTGSGKTVWVQQANRI